MRQEREKKKQKLKKAEPRWIYYLSIAVKGWKKKKKRGKNDHVVRNGMGQPVQSKNNNNNNNNRKKKKMHWLRSCKARKHTHKRKKQHSKEVQRCFSLSQDIMQKKKTSKNEKKKTVTTKTKTVLIQAFVVRGKMRRSSNNKEEEEEKKKKAHIFTGSGRRKSTDRSAFFSFFFFFSPTSLHASTGELQSFPL